MAAIVFAVISAAVQLNALEPVELLRTEAELKLYKFNSSLCDIAPVFRRASQMVLAGQRRRTLYGISNKLTD